MSTLDEPANAWQYILSAVEVSHPFVVNAAEEEFDMQRDVHVTYVAPTRLTAHLT